MKRLNWKQVVVAVVVMAFGSAVYAESTAGQLYKQGYSAETADRDPAKAIDFYKKVLAQTADQDSLAAKAHLRIGICFEKIKS